MRHASKSVTPKKTTWRAPRLKSRSRPSDQRQFWRASARRASSRRIRWRISSSRRYLSPCRRPVLRPPHPARQPRRGIFRRPSAGTQPQLQHRPWQSWPGALRSHAGRQARCSTYRPKASTRRTSNCPKWIGIIANNSSPATKFQSTPCRAQIRLREVTSERIRDKIAASKRKGLWVGGPLPLGYEMKDGKIAVVEDEAERVRLIYRRYLELSGVNALVRDLRDKDIRTKIRLRATGATHG